MRVSSLPFLHPNLPETTSQAKQQGYSHLTVGLFADYAVCKHKEASAARLPGILATGGVPNLVSTPQGLLTAKLFSIPPILFLFFLLLLPGLLLFGIAG